MNITANNVSKVVQDEFGKYDELE